MSKVHLCLRATFFESPLLFLTSMQISFNSIFISLPDLSALQQHRHLFEGTVERLRSLLLQRKSAMDVFHKAATILRPKLQRFNASNPVRLHAGNIGIVRILGETLQSPVQLLKRVEALRLPQRNTRSTRQAFQSSAFVLDVPRVAKIRHLTVGNLLYNGSLLPGRLHTHT